MQNFSGFLKQKSDKWDNFSSLKSVDINTSEKAKEIKAALTHAIQNKEIPGAVFILAWGGKIIIKEVLGYRQIFPNLEEMTSDTICDLASLTKVVATWSSILVLLQKKSIKINAAISEYLKISRGTPLEEVTIFDLLTHTSGLPERTYLSQYGESREAIISGICSTGLMCPKNKHVIYSNRGYILLGFIIEEISQQTLAKFVTREFWQPLQMNDTFFNPSSSFPKDCAHRIPR